MQFGINVKVNTTLLMFHGMLSDEIRWLNLYNGSHWWGN